MAARDLRWLGLRGSSDRIAADPSLHRLPAAAYRPLVGDRRLVLGTLGSAVHMTALTSPHRFDQSYAVDANPGLHHRVNDAVALNFPLVLSPKRRPTGAAHGP